MKSCSHTWNIKLTKKGLSFSCTTSSSWGILLVTLGFLKKIRNIENRSVWIKKIKYKNTTRSRFSGKVWYARCNKSKELRKNECQRREINLLLLQNVIKLKRILSAIMMGLCNRWCMYHEVYQQLVVIFVPKPLTVSKWRIIVGHSLNHISCDSSWFSPDTGHRSSESCFSGCHLCIVIDLNVKAASSNVLTVVRFTPLNYTTDAREVIDWLLFCIS